jgi:AraC family transcriptional regulator
MTQPFAFQSGTGLSQFSDPGFLNERFNPGAWLDRRQLNTPSAVVISGNYERKESILGEIYTENVHFYDLCLAQRAAGSRGQLVDDFRAPQPLGDVLFVPAGSRYVGGGGPGKQHNMFVFLHAGKLRAEDPQLAEILASPGREEFMDLRCDRIRYLLTQISRELYNPGFASEMMVEGLSMTLLAETARLVQEAHGSDSCRGGLAPVNLRRIRERVLELGAPPSLEELAAMCKLSKRHLMRAFRESTGQTIGQFIQYSALEKARHWLRNSDKSIGAIASELGFANISSFSTAFRRLTGESPRAYRAGTSAVACRLGDGPALVLVDHNGR